MSGYSPRRGPNVSQYIANLNTIPSVHDLESQQQEDYSLEDDLALFTNTEFFDFDARGNVEQTLVNYDPAQEGPAAGEGVAAKYSNDDVTGLDLNNSDFSFPELGPFLAAATVNPPPLQTTLPSAPPFDLNAYNLPTSPYTATPLNPPSKRSYAAASPTSLTPTVSSPPNLEASSRAAAEEDKRRRNTAASARFRVKKKQREQALEKTAKEMTDRADALEARIAQLEMENKWLRNLVVEKTAAGKDDVAELWQKFSKENEMGRRGEGVKKGVGTTTITDDEEKKA
ncbi:MAG: hypothetical protein Q9187_005247 [Circinaria calcarea]